MFLGVFVVSYQFDIIAFNFAVPFYDIDTIHSDLQHSQEKTESNCT